MKPAELTSEVLPEARPVSWLRRAVTIGPGMLLATLIGLPLAFEPLRNADLFFHLAGGRWLLDHGFDFPDVDPFSFTANGAWVPHEWGFGVLAELSVRAFGARGPALLTSALVIAGALVLWELLRREQREKKQGLTILALFALALATQSFSWNQERPYHAGHALFAVTLVLLQSWRWRHQSPPLPLGEGQGEGLLALIAIPIVIAWVNLHGSWILAPALIGATAAGAWLDGTKKRPAAKLAAAAIGCWLAGAASPQGLSALLYPVKHALLPTTRALIEWRAPSLADDYTVAFLVLTGATLVAIARAPRIQWALVLPAAGLTVAAFGAQRHIPYAAMTLSVAAVAHLRRRLSDEVDSPGREALRRLNEGIASWAKRSSGWAWPVVGLAAIAVTAGRDPIPVREGLLEGLYPLAAFDRLRELPPGRVLNDFVLGGAIAYFTGDEHKVFIDGRNDPFSEEIHADYLALRELHPDWREALARHEFDYILWFDHGLIEALRASPDWEPVLEDAGAVLLRRR